MTLPQEAACIDISPVGMLIDWLINWLIDQLGTTCRLVTHLFAVLRGTVAYNRVRPVHATGLVGRAHGGAGRRYAAEILHVVHVRGDSVSFEGFVENLNYWGFHFSKTSKFQLRPCGDGRRNSFLLLGRFEDGSVDWSEEGNFYWFIHQSINSQVTLGTQPVQLVKFTPDDQHVFACSDRPTVIYSLNKKLVCILMNQSIYQTMNRCSRM